MSIDERLLLPEVEQLPAVGVRAERPRRWSGGNTVAAVLTGAGAVLWAQAVQGMDERQIGDSGLISIIGPRYTLAVVMATAGFVTAITRRRIVVPLLIVQLGLLLMLVHGVAPLIESEPPYFSAYLHTGFVEHIYRTGHTLPALDARFNWPGSFAFGALLTRIAGVDDALFFVRWSPVFFNALYLVPIWSIVSSLTGDRRVRWLTLWLFLGGNWLHQDYLSPQALCFLLYLVILAVVLGWFRTDGPKDELAASHARWTHRWRAQLSLLPLVRWCWVDVDERKFDLTVPRWSSPEVSVRARAALVVILPVIASAIVASHQLTPMVLVASLGALVLCRRTSLPTLPVICLVLFAAWFAFAATAFWLGHLESVTGGAGKLGSNVGSSLGHRMNGTGGRSAILSLRMILAAATLVLAGTGFLRRLREGYVHGAFLIPMLVPFLLIGGQSYGGEILLRSYLFALPFACMFVALAIFPDTLRRRGVVRPALTFALAVPLAMAGIAARYGNEQFERVDRDDLAAVRYLYAHAPIGSKIISASRNLPWRLRAIDSYEYRPVDDAIVTDSRQVLSFLTGGPRPAYFVASDAQQVFGRQLYGLAPHWLDRLERQLLGTGRLHTVFNAPHARVYLLNPKEGSHDEKIIDRRPTRGRLARRMR